MVRGQFGNLNPSTEDSGIKAFYDDAFSFADRLHRS